MAPEQDPLRPAGPTLDRPRPAAPREGYLALLADRRKLAIMDALYDAPLPPAELAQRVEVSERRVRHHMRELARYGVAVRISDGLDPRRVAWKLGAGGRELLRLHELIVGCEQRLGSGGPRARRRPLVQALHSAQMRAVLWALSPAPLPLAELERRLPQIPHTTLEHCLRRLRESGLVEMCVGEGSRRYELRHRARGALGLIALSAVRWRLLFTPRQPPEEAGNLLGLVMLVASLARVATGAQGVCVMQALSGAAAEEGPSRWPDARLSVLRGRISAMPAGSPHTPQARMRGSDLVWCEALLGGDASPIEVEGDEALAHAVLAALVAALHA